MKKLLLIFFGLFLCMLFLELGLRVAGFTYLYLQEQGNKRSLNNNDTYKILCLGESTTQGQYPGYLEADLNNRNPGRKFSVIDKGRGATITNYIFANLENNLDKYKPDIVMTMMGVNDGNSDIVIDEYEKMGSMYKKLRTYKLIRLISLHLKSKLGQLKEGKIKAVKVQGNEPGLIEKARYHQDRKEYKEAQDRYKKAIEANPADEQAYLGLADSYGSTGRSEEALNLCKKTLTLNPMNELVYIKLGNCYMEQKRYSEAQEIYTKAIVMNPKNELAYMKLGDCYNEQGISGETEKLYGKALDINPKNELACMRLGNFYWKQGKLEQAKELYKKAIEINPKNEIYVTLGDRYGLRGELKQARELYKKAIEMNPRQEKAFYALSMIYEAENRHDEAAKILKEGMKRENENDMETDTRISNTYDKGYLDLEFKYRKIKEETRSFYFGPGTVHNYKRLRKILKERNITYVCMQYPLRETADLKNIFAGDKNIIFVDNEKIFREGVENEGYDAYFRDRFAGNFGHCTVKGNKLLADNIEKTIISEVFSGSRQSGMPQIQSHSVKRGFLGGTQNQK